MLRALTGGQVGERSMLFAGWVLTPRPWYCNMTVHHLGGGAMVVKVLVGVVVLIVAVSLMQGTSETEDVAQPVTTTVETTTTTVPETTTVPDELSDQEIAILAVQLTVIQSGFTPPHSSHLIEEIILLHCVGIAELGGNVEAWAVVLLSTVVDEYEAVIAGATLAVAGYWCPEYAAAIDRFVNN